jgi:hypothetical protein
MWVLEGKRATLVTDERAGASTTRPVPGAWGRPAGGTQRACAGPEGTPSRARGERSARPGSAGARRSGDGVGVGARSRPRLCGLGRERGGGGAPEPRGRAGLARQEQTAVAEKTQGRGRRAQPLPCAPQRRRSLSPPGLAAAPGDFTVTRA